MSVSRSPFGNRHPDPECGYYVLHQLLMGLLQHSLKHRLARGALLMALAVTASAAQDSRQPGTRSGNPLERDPTAIRDGDVLFHQRCAVCHGQQGQGAMAANLILTRSVRRGSQAALFALIRKGIPGTEMPPQPDLPDEGIWQIISYLRSMALPGQQPPPDGDPEAGFEVFRRAGCGSCHIVNGFGGFLGPSLDSIGVRKTSDKIRLDVVDPDADFAQGYEPVAVETHHGRRIEGVLKNEDTFMVVILTPAGEVEAFQRDRLRSVSKLARSRMPSDYGTRLSPEELGNLLAFLDRQRDPFTPVVRGFRGY